MSKSRKRKSFNCKIVSRKGKISIPSKGEIKKYKDCKKRELRNCMKSPKSSSSKKSKCKKEWQSMINFEDYLKRKRRSLKLSRKRSKKYYRRRKSSSRRRKFSKNKISSPKTITRNGKKYKLVGSHKVEPLIRYKKSHYKKYGKVPEILYKGNVYHHY